MEYGSILSLSLKKVQILLKENESDDAYSFEHAGQEAMGYIFSASTIEQSSAGLKSSINAAFML